MIAILALLSSLAQDAEGWQFNAETGAFVHTASAERKTPAEFLQLGLALQQDSPQDSVTVLDLLVLHAPDPRIQESAHAGRVQSRLKSGTPFEAYNDAENFLVRFPQSDRATAVKRLEMTAALELIRKGHGGVGFGLFASSRPGMELLKAALRRYPREEFTPEFYQELGNYHYERGRYEDAELEYSFILDRHGDSPWFVLALFMLARCREHRFNSLDYEMKPLRDAKRHFERFLEEAERMRRLPEPAARWVDDQIGIVKERLDRIRELMADKELRVAGHYETRGFPKSAAVHYRAVVRLYPKTRAAAAAQARLDEAAK